MTNQEPTPMFIAVNLVVVLKDPAEWTTAFGVEKRTDIRRDVKSYILNHVQQAGAFGSGEVDGDISLTN